MAKTDSLYVRIDPALKSSVETIYARYGLRVTDAINIFLHQSVNVGGLPFDMRDEIPNAETFEAMREVEDIIAGKIPAKQYSSFEEFLADLDADEDDDTHRHPDGYALRLV
jgi:DNA-damage-inducible protein J